MTTPATPPVRRIGLIRGCTLALVAALSLGASCEELGTSSVETSFGMTFTLTADRPVVTRSLDYVAEAGDQPVYGVTGLIEVVGLPGEWHPDVWLSIMNLQTGDSIDRPEGIGSASVDGGAHAAPCDGKPTLHDGEFRSNPVPPCQATWTVIARWLEPEPGVEIPLALNGSMRAHADRLYPEDEPFALKTFAVMDAGVPLPVDGPAVTRASARGSARVTPSSGRETHQWLLRVPAALLEQDADGLRLGRIFIGIDRKEWSGHPMTMRTELSIGDEVVASASAPVSMERDWLSRCEPGVACELPITLTFEPVSASAAGATMPPDGLVAIDWVVETRFEDFGEGATVAAELEFTEP